MHRVLILQVCVYTVLQDFAGCVPGPRGLMEMVMEARGMQAAIEAITRVNSSSREEVEWRGIRAHLKKPLHQVDCLAVLGGSVKSCSLIAPIWGFIGGRVKGGARIPYRGCSMLILPGT